MRREMIKNGSHEIWDCQKIARGAQVLAAEPNFMVKLQAEGRQFSVNPKSLPPLAMKYAIGEITFLGVWSGMSLGSDKSKPRNTAKSPREVSHEVCNWQKLFSRPSHTCARVVTCERASVTKSFPIPCGETKIEVSHERFNWLKNSWVARIIRRCILLEVRSSAPYRLLFQLS